MDPTLAELINALSSIATSGGFGVLAWWLITKSIPDREKLYDERCAVREAAHQKEREHWLEKIKGVHVECEKKLEDLHRETLSRLEQIVREKN